MKPTAIGIDIGYGYTKSYTVFDDGVQRKVFTPTAVSRYVPNFHFAPKIRIIKVNSRRFAIGEDLLANSIFCESTMRDDFFGSPPYMAMLGYILSHYTYPIEVLVTGIPPNFYNEETAEKLVNTIKEQWLTDDKGRKIIIPETIKVIPQGAGIFISFISTYPSLFKEKVMVMDIGYHTLDLVFFSDGKYREDMSRSYDLGVNVVYDKIRNLFSRTFGTFPKDDNVLDEIIKNGKYRDFEGEHPIDVSEILDYYRNAVRDTIMTHIRRSTPGVQYFVAGGGGLSLAKDIIENINLVNDPQFANAIGFFHYGRQFLQNPISS